MTATDAGGVLRLEFRLTDDKTQLPRIASLAAGRMLREDAVPAFGGEGGHAFLWQNLPADADASAMRRGFESFAASCDWWRERLSGAAQDTEETPRPEMMIRP